MRIIIDNKVKEYLRTIGRWTLTIDSEMVGSCWSPRPEIFVRPKEPVAYENYDKFDLEDIKIYLYKEAKVDEEIRIEMAKYASDLPNKEIAVYGIDLS